MKTGLIALLISLIPAGIPAQSAILPSPLLSQGIPTSLGMALGKGDVDAIISFCSQDIELTLLNENETEKVTKNVAKDRLTEFYTAYSPRGYHVHSVVNKTRETGELVTLKGTFKVNIVYRDMESGKLVNALSITPVGDVSLQ